MQQHVSGSVSQVTCGFSFWTITLTGHFLNTSTWAVGEKDSGEFWVFTSLPVWLASCLRKVIAWRIPFAWNIKCASPSAMLSSTIEDSDFVFYPLFCLLFGRRGCPPASMDRLAQPAARGWRDIHHAAASSLPSSRPFQQYMWTPPKQTPRKEIKIKLILSKDK